MSFPILSRNIHQDVDIYDMFWINLSTNPNSFHLLETNIDKVDWFYLSLNPNAIHLLKNNQDKIDWNNLSLNPNAIHLLKNNLNKINWIGLSSNPNALYLFIDYEATKERNRLFNEELVSYVFHPKRLENLAQEFSIDLDELLEFY